MHPLNKEQETALHGLPIMAVARTLGIGWWKLPNLYFDGRREMDQVIRSLKPFNGISEVLRKLHNEGHELFIVSSNSVKNIRAFLKHHHLQEYFIEIYGGVEVFGKASMLHQLLRENSLKVQDVVSVGDESRDIEASKSVGMRTVAVTWGFAREEDLEALKPTAICKNPNELLATLELV